jgi:heptosyltransferase-3
MSILKTINIYRRKITFSLFSKPLSRNKRSNVSVDVNTIKKILIVRPNHRLGNQLLLTPLLQEVIAQFPNAKIELFLKGSLGNILFKNYPEVNKIIALPKKHFKQIIAYIKCWFYLKNRKYDLVINLVHNSSSGSIATNITKSNWKLYGAIENSEKPVNADYFHIAKKPVYDLREELRLNNIKVLREEIFKIDLKLDADELALGKEKLKEISNSEKEVICIFTFATNDKCYSKEWWHEFYEKLLGNFSNYTIIEILPFENVSQIDFKAPSYYSKDIREMASVIANTKLFIGADSGIMHLSSATKTTTVGLFSVTNVEIYKPYSKQNLGINTNEVTKDEIINQLKVLL